MTREKLPGDYVRSKTGKVAYIVLSRKRDPKTHEPLVRLRFPNGVIGNGTFTIEQLKAEGAVFLKRRPAAFREVPASDENGKKAPAKRRSKRVRRPKAKAAKAPAPQTAAAEAAAPETATPETAPAAETTPPKAAPRAGKPYRHPLPPVGTKLTARYKGTEYEVTVVDGGVEWNGSVYRSLSAAGCAITGRSTCNGPAFFKLAVPVGGAA